MRLLRWLLRLSPAPQTPVDLRCAAWGQGWEQIERAKRLALKVGEQA